MQHRARKRFGQNFLEDLGIIEAILYWVSPQKTDHFIEIGPGLGAISFALAPQCQSLSLIEIDRDLASNLREKTQNDPKITLYETDALKFDFTQLTQKHPCRIIGNLPYNISTPLIFHILENTHDIQDMHFMLQKEVVERMAASPGSKQYGRLSIMTQYFCRTEMGFIVPPEAFYPIPKVESQMIRLIPHESKPFIAKDFAFFSELILKGFSQRRKTLRNALKNLIDLDTFALCGIDPQDRIENLSLEKIVLLANTMYNKR